MTIRHYLIGYGKDQTGPEIEYLIPEDQMAEVKKHLPLYPDDPDALDPYELLPWQVKTIAQLAGHKVMRPQAHQFWLQAFDDPVGAPVDERHRATA
jgi:hypothetical protein